MSNNIFQIISEEHMNDIINRYIDTLIVVMYSSSNICEDCPQIKRQFIELSKNNPNNLFIYVCVENYKDSSGKYTNDFNIEHLPTFIFLYNANKIGDVCGSDYSILVDTFNQIKTIIDEELSKLVSEKKNHELVENQIFFDDDEKTKRKLILMGYFYKFAKYGIDVNLRYTVLSNLDDMEKDYLHFNDIYTIMEEDRIKKDIEYKKQLEKEDKILKAIELEREKDILNEKKLEYLNSLMKLANIREI